MTNRLISALFCLPFLVHAQTASEVRRLFVSPPDDARIMMRWWWFGPAVTKPQLEAEMRAMKLGGIGGFEVQPVYPLALDDPAAGVRNHPYLSDDFIDALRFTSQKSKELGLRMDLTLGSGWPFGGPHIPGSQAPGRLRVDRVKIPAGARQIPVPDLANIEKLITVFNGPQQLPLTIHNGMLRLPEAAAGEAVFFISSSTGMQVKRASAGAEGFVLDHYNRQALDNHLKNVGDRLMQAFRGIDKPFAIFSDSLEVFGSDWTSDFLFQFQERRGYDLKPHLPALVGDFGPNTAAVRYDWGRTLTELGEDRYLKPLQAWARANGVKLRSQTYGTPPVTITSQSLVDLPEGEGHHWRQFSTARWAASGSHLYGKPVTSSETWTWLHSPSFRATPLDMKAEADRHFLQGINQLIGHGWPYSPPSFAYPGTRFYASAVFNDRNPWWIVMPDVTRYLQRTSFALRQGKPANDIALYLPINDAYCRFTAGRNSVDRAMEGLLGPTLIPQILDAGYNFDFIDDRAIESLGITHAVLVLPDIERIPLSVYQKIAGYARNGGIVIATKRLPSRAPGMNGSEQEVAALSAQLFPDGAITEDALGSALASRLKPDCKPAAMNAAIGCVHRKLDDADLYFIANTSNGVVDTQISFRTTYSNAEWWNPHSAAFMKAEGATVPLHLEPYESRFILFTRSSTSASPASPIGEGKTVLDLSSNWKVTFPALSLSTETAQLQSWTSNEATKFYSGTATYEKTVTLTADQAKPALWLDFGRGTTVDAIGRRGGPSMRAQLEPPIREVAVVYVNGKAVGSVWKPPFEISLSGHLQPGANQLRIVVANTAMNHMAGRPLPNYRLLNLRYGERFTPQDMNQISALPSGILGPVKLITRP